MRRILSLFLLLGTTLQAQTQEALTPSLPPPPQGVEDDWQNWTFAACALLVAAAGILVISTGTGQSASGHH